MLRMGGCTSPPGALRAPTSPLRGEAKPRHLAGRAPRADLPTAWGGETSPPGCARSARRPPHCVGRRNLPTRRAPRADLPTAWGGDTSPPGALRAPTSPLRGEAKPPHCVGEAKPPHPARSAPGADLPAEREGDSRRPPRRDRLRLAGPRAGWYSAPKPWPDGFSAWLGLNVPTKGHFVVYWRFVHARPLILPIS